jgi:hypothetical protein
MRLRLLLLLQPPRGGVLCVLGRDSGGMKLLLVGVVWAGVVDVLRFRTRRHVAWEQIQTPTISNKVGDQLPGAR